MTSLIGQSLGRYHILEQLGEGGMAVVYKALDTSLQRHVAVKVILPYRQHSEKFLKRFEREARALARLSHPNILKIFDYGEYQGLPYLVMEYIPGGTLAQKLIGKPLPWQSSANILARVARALETAHQQGIVHRDVKPANILISNSREPLLSDFGIAKLVEDDEETADLTGSGVGIGTPQYMAPEQGLGHADARSDVYALGVIYYEMVTGRKPYQADTPMAIMLKKNTEPLPRPTSYVPALPASVENVLIKALARDPNQRYKDMGAFANALETLISVKTTPMQNTLSGTTTFEDAPGLLPFITQHEESAPVRRKGWISWGIGGIALVACCVVALGSLMVGRYLAAPTSTPTKSATLTITPTETPSPTKTFTTTPSPTQTFTATPSPTQTFTATPSPTYVTLTVPGIPPEQSVNGTWIAFNSKMSGNENIYIIDVNGDNLTKLTTSTAHNLYPSWSPDGKQIVYQTNEGEDQELIIFDLATKKSRQLTSNVCNDWGPSWSPDGEWIAFYSDCNGERDIFKVQTNGNGRQQLTYSSGSYSWFPAWSGDGRQITFTSNRSDGYQIYVMNADGSDQVKLARGCVSYFSPDGSQIVYGVYCDDTDDLWVMNSDGSNQHPITDGCECKNATWSPDGTKIIFAKSLSGKDGPFGIFTLSLSNPQPANWIQITIYDVNGRSPSWQPYK